LLIAAPILPLLQPRERIPKLCMNVQGGHTHFLEWS